MDYWGTLHKIWFHRQQNEDNVWKFSIVHFHIVQNMIHQKHFRCWIERVLLVSSGCNLHVVWGRKLILFIIKICFSNFVGYMVKVLYLYCWICSILFILCNRLLWVPRVKALKGGYFISDIWSIFFFWLLIELGTNRLVFLC